MATVVPAFHPYETFTDNLIAFCALLRQEHGFTIGPGQSIAAARAVEVVGVGNDRRVRQALRLVLCASPEEIAVFDRAFTAFFLPEPPRGALQHNLNPRHTRPQPPTPPRGPARETPERPQSPPTESDSAVSNAVFPAVQRRDLSDEPDDGASSAALHAHYSALAAATGAPQIPRDNLEVMLEAAGVLVQRLRLGRSRRWHAMPRGPRLDLRGTLRKSLQTGGELVAPRWLGHPPRNPRLVVIVDGSRSMEGAAGVMLQFAYALSQRTRRMSAFVFSTDLREVTAQLRQFERGAPLQLDGLTAAWGGGTRIGACLREFIATFGHRCLSEQTVVFILSDGLDVGEPERLEAALRDLRRRSAALIWLNPLLAVPGYAPTARGMQAALPHLTLFSGASDAAGFLRLARTLRI